MTASEDGPAKVWNAGTGGCTQTSGHGACVMSSVFCSLRSYGDDSFQKWHCVNLGCSNVERGGRRPSATARVPPRAAAKYSRSGGGCHARDSVIANGFGL